MAALYEIREKVILLFRQYENIVVSVVKFAAVLVGLLYINSKMGYMGTINSILPVLIASLICALAPAGMAAIVYALFIILHLYGLSLEAAAVGLVYLLILLLVYFRFSPKDSMLMAMFPAACALGVPYAIPIAGGLLFGPSAAITGAVCFAVKGFCGYVSDNAEAIGTKSSAEAILDKLRLVIDGVMDNNKLIVLAAAALLAALAVYVIRRLSIKQSWYIAVAAGCALQFIIVLVGVLSMGINMSVIGLIAGIVFSGVIGCVISFVMFNLDYSGIQHTQFEDAEYYYYVKAVPKIGYTGADSKERAVAADSYDYDGYDSYDSDDGILDYDSLDDDFYEED